MTAGSAPPKEIAATAIRNVVLVGRAGSGKTTLLETLLAATGAIPRTGRVEDGTTVSDHDPVEVRQQRSVQLSVAQLDVADVRINMIDTPGYADFVGDVRAGLRAADAALFIISAVDGVDAGTRVLWEECASVGMPRAIVITRLDHQRADFEATVDSCQQAFGQGVLPLYLPLHTHSGTAGGLIGLLSRRVYDYSDGSRREREPEAEHLPLIADARDTLIEGIIAESEDETLLERYLGGEELDVKALVDDLETAVARGSFYPVLGFAAPAVGTTVGSAELLELLTSAFPSPVEHGPPVVTAPDGEPVPALVCDPDGPLVAEVVKTSSDPYVGRLSIVRVFSGTLRPDTPVHVSGHGRAAAGHADHDLDEKIGHLSSPLGRTLRPRDRCVAGDICAVAKLAHAETGDTLSSRDLPLLVEAWTMPEPLLPVAVEAATRADEDKLGQALARLVAEDPTLRLVRDPETHQTVLWCLGEAHADLLLDRLRNRHHVEVTTVELRVPLRETFISAARGTGRHVKQSGGHGQYAVVTVNVEPLPAGSGFTFADRTVGGCVPGQFVGSVEKGVRTQLDRGVLAGYPVVDLAVTLVDGKAHSVDSSDLAFQTAGALALRDAATKSSVTLLEPVLRLSVLVTDDDVGAVLGDLAARRGRVAGTEPVAGTGRTLVRAEVPETEVTRYAVDLRGLSHGTGSFTRTYLRHEPMPSQLVTKLTR